MNFYRYGKLFLPLLLATQFSMAQKTLKVAKDGSAAFTSIQNAIDQALPGDIIEIEDMSIYEEQITIDSTKSGLVLKSKNPASLNKPVIRWQDTKNQLPKSYYQSHFPDSINYYKNGALRVLGARNIIINGIKVDGAGAAPFEWENVWSNRFPLFHGNSAITLWECAGVVIRNCEISNAYFGVYVWGGIEGGIFANPHQADTRIEPVSRFGQAGNHIIEDNRIHDNSWGVFFESAWDQGSIIRYNLFYENHHTSSIKDQMLFFIDGTNQPGGALFFKDVMLSPIAIHNNTLWHNHTSIAGHWHAGAHFLVFNNIVAQPDISYNEMMSMDPVYVNRMHHCLYAAQNGFSTINRSHYFSMLDPEGRLVDKNVQVTGVDQVRIMNGMDKVEIEGMTVTVQIQLSSGPIDTSFFVDWAIQPGARVISPFGTNSTVRWFEMKFLSTDTNSPDFLVPDWDDPDVKRLVLDQGWPEAGILDADGSIADLGAIPKGGKASFNTVIHAVNPVIVDGSNANVTFDLLGIGKESLNNLSIKYIRWIKNVDFVEGSFGSEIAAISASSIVDVTASGEPLKMGTNNIHFSIPARASNEHFAFIEMIFEGKNLEGKTELSSVGFVPFRKLDYIFEVRILDYATGKIELDQIKEGELVKLSITPKKTDGVLFDSVVSICNLSLHSGYVLYTAQGDTLKMQEVLGNQVKDCYFAKAPSNGYDRVSIGGSYGANAFSGSSKSIRVLPGDINRKVLKKPVSSAEIKIKFLGGNLLLTNSTQIGPGEQLTLELFNILGCRVARYVVGSGSPKQFNLDKLSSGLYFCVVNFRGSVVKTNLNIIK